MVAKRDPFALYCDEPSLTKQSFKDECDINLIIERVRDGGALNHVNARAMMYADVSQFPDYRTALDFVNGANDMFMSLDARIRERFSNDPGKLLEFLQDSKNREEATRLGLVEPALQEKAVVVDSKPVSGDSKDGK